MVGVGAGTNVVGWTIGASVATTITGVCETGVASFDIVDMHPALNSTMSPRSGITRTWGVILISKPRNIQNSMVFQSKRPWLNAPAAALVSGNIEAQRRWDGEVRDRFIGLGHRIRIVNDSLRVLVVYHTVQ
jgi:hypothetical protein